MNTIILIDGHNLLFRMFYGMTEPVIGTDGKSVHAALGFIGAVCNIINQLHPTHMVVLFDSQDCGERRQLDPEYKANRPDYSAMSEEECPFTQLPYIYRALDTMGIAYSEVHGWEADDVIASYALTYTGEPDMMLGIVSTDKDYYQLISENVWIVQYSGRGIQYVNPDVIMSKYSIPPTLFADFKCLIGDKSDNIPGAAGIGPKYAAELLNQFGSLDGIIENRSQIARASHRKSIEEAKDRLLHNRELILLKNDAPLPFETLDEIATPRQRWYSASKILDDAGIL